MKAAESSAVHPYPEEPSHVGTSSSGVFPVLFSWPRNSRGHALCLCAVSGCPAEQHVDGATAIHPGGLSPRLGESRSAGAPPAYVPVHLLGELNRSDFTADMHGPLRNRSISAAARRVRMDEIIAPTTGWQ